MYERPLRSREDVKTGGRSTRPIHSVTWTHELPPVLSVVRLPRCNDAAIANAASKPVRRVAAHAPRGGRHRGVAGIDAGRFAGRSQPASGRCRPLRLPQPTFAGRHPCRRSRPRQDHRGGLGDLATLGGATAQDSHHRPGQPAQAVASGTAGQVQPAGADPRSQELQRHPQAGAAEPVPDALGPGNLLLPVRQGQGQRHQRD